MKVLKIALLILLVIGSCLLDFSNMEASFVEGAFDLTTIVKEMTVDATHIVVGKVTHVSFVNDDSLSLVKVRVYKDMKAEIEGKTPSKTVTFVQVGGPYPLIEGVPFLTVDRVTAVGYRTLKRGEYVFLRLQPTRHPFRFNGKTVNTGTDAQGTTYSVREEGDGLDKHIIEKGWLGMDVTVSQMTRIVRATLKEPERMLALAGHVKGLGRMPLVSDEKGRISRLQPDTRLPIVMAEIERIEKDSTPSPLAGGAWSQSEGQEELTFELVEGIKFADGTEVKSIAQSDIEVLRGKPIYMGRENRATLTNDKREKVFVRTCRGYDAALAAGFYPDTNLNILRTSSLEYPCRTLNLLERAIKPKRSFLLPSEELYDLKLLPLSLFPVITDFEQTYGYNIENETYQDRADKGLLKVIKPEGRSDVCYENDGFRQYLTQIVRTDFNGDGIEDVLLYEAVYAHPRGSYRTYDLIILTRKSADGKFERVEPQIL